MPNLFLCYFTLREIINRHGCQVAKGKFKWIKDKVKFSSFLVNHPAVRSMRVWMHILD